MKKVLIIGCATSGYWCAKLLNQKGYEVFLTDAKSIIQKEELIKLGIKIFENGHPEELKNIDYEFVVKNPGIPYTNEFVHYFVEHNFRILTEIEIAYLYSQNFTYAAITGTNGKTTTTTMLYEILKKEGIAYASGNIGTALSDTVFNHALEKANISLEISAFQLLGAPSFRPLVSCITNLTPDHQDYFHNLDEYYKAKCLVYQNQRDDDWFLKNIDDPEINKYCTDVKCRIVTYSLTSEADLKVKDDWVYLFDKPLFKPSDLKVVGQHNLLNAMVAAAMAYKMGIKEQTIREVLSDFKGVEHRIEYVCEIDGVRYYNDSKGTTMDSTIVALKSFDKPVILLAGGHDKKIKCDVLFEYADKIKKLIVFGETKFDLARLKKDAVIVDNMKDAVEVAYNIAESGDIVLLSPTTSSYDQFKNFEERGELFKEYVMTLGL